MTVQTLLAEAGNFSSILDKGDQSLGTVSSKSCMLHFISGRCFLLLETNSSDLKKNISLLQTPYMIKCNTFLIMIDLVYMQCMHKTALVQVWTAEHISQSCEASFLPKQCLHFLYNGESTIGTRKCFFLSCGFHPMKCFSGVFPFKVLFHVQNAMHAIAKYCSSVEKPTNI